MHVNSKLPRVADLLAVTDEARFLELHPRPFLVVVGQIAEEDGEHFEFYTTTAAVYSQDEAAEIVAGNRLDPNARLIEVVKREGANPFSALITVGRADNCDIVLRTGSISKFHAYIATIPQLDDTLEYQLADSGSRNGTKLNDTRLAPKELVALRDGDRVDLGGVIFLRFYSPRGLWQELEKLRPA